MKGLAHTLLTELEGRLTLQPFRLATAILQARVVPRYVTPDLDDPEVEHRLQLVLTVANGGPAIPTSAGRNTREDDTDPVSRRRATPGNTRA